MAHKNKKFHDKCKTAGLTVIVGHELGRFVVQRYMEVDKDGKLVARLGGVDVDGEPIERLNGNGGQDDPATVTYIQQEHEQELFCGNTVSEVKLKMQAKQPDFLKRKGAKNVERISTNRK